MKKYVRTVACAAGVGATWAYFSRAARKTQRQQVTGKVVLITGGSRGFGLALAQEFASLHCPIALCARDADELNRAKQILSDQAREVFTIACDVTDRDAISQAVAAVTRHYGQIDILINNAGEITVSPFENLEIEDFERAMAVMFWGMLYATSAVLPAMKARGDGRIVNVTSIGGKVSVPHLLSYNCAKAAAVALSNGLAGELRQFGIRVTTIIPGLMRTGSHVKAKFKGNRSSEAGWFGSAASFPLLSLSAEHAARMAVDAICAGRPEKVLGVPAQILAQTQNLMPGLTAHLMQLGNACLPKGTSDGILESGSELEGEHGPLYGLLTTLGRQAGQRLNQRV